MTDKKYVLEGKKMQCPKCGSTSSLYRPELLPVLTPVEVDEDGRWDWADRMYSTWMGSVTIKDTDFIEEWYCRDCETHFDAPNVKNVDEEEDNEDA